MQDMIIKLLSTEAVMALIIGAFVTYIVKWLATKDGEKFKQYEGYAITAIKAAEKAIPDGVDNKGLARADFALKTFLSAYQKATGVNPNEKDIAKIESWIAEIHSIIESSGILKK